MNRDPLPPGSVIGILGGGQLGRMLAIAAAKLGFKSIVYAPKDDSPAFHVAFRHFNAGYDDAARLVEFAKSCDVVTFEFENVPAETLEACSAHCPVYPPARAAEYTQDRIAERRFLLSLPLPVAPHAVIESEGDLANAATFLAKSGGGILKRAREGYDGKGQARLSSPSELAPAFAQLGGPCVLEALVAFSAEISVIAVRSLDGAVKCYDIPENRHEDGILRSSTVPAALPPALENEARAIAETIACALDYVGVLGIEMFVACNPERLIVNEIAPRVHNSGHWTLEACHVSQFENHIRAIAGWPLGDTSRHSDAVMTNLIGSDALKWREILDRNPKASLYLYGKGEVREGRKLGHVTTIARREKR